MQYSDQSTQRAAPLMCLYRSRKVVIGRPCCRLHGSRFGWIHVTDRLSALVASAEAIAATGVMSILCAAKKVRAMTLLLLDVARECSVGFVSKWTDAAGCGSGVSPDGETAPEASGASACPIQSAEARSRPVPCGGSRQGMRRGSISP